MYIPDNIGEYWMGRVVQKFLPTLSDQFGRAKTLYGHIIGFGEPNSHDELQIKVRWCGSDTEYEIHPSHIILL